MSLSTDAAAVRILIVDDQASNVRLLEHTLRRGGYVNVMSTTDPSQVEALHGENHYELVLLDLQMPGLNGFQVMKQLRAGEGGQRIAILVISADPRLGISALEGGANSFLSKPFVLTDVLDRVHLLLKAAPETVEGLKAEG